jgi:hypothetical protein
MCYELSHTHAGDLKRAEDHFRYVHDRAAKGVAMKRKYLFGSLVGLVSEHPLRPLCWVHPVCEQFGVVTFGNDDYLLLMQPACRAGSGVLRGAEV